MKAKSTGIFFLLFKSSKICLFLFIYFFHEQNCIFRKKIKLYYYLLQTLDAFTVIIIYDLLSKYMYMWSNNKKCSVYLPIQPFLSIIYSTDSWEKIIGRGGNLATFEIKHRKFFSFEFFLAPFSCSHKVSCHVAVNLRDLWQTLEDPYLSK